MSCKYCNRKIASDDETRICKVCTDEIDGIKQKLFSANETFDESKVEYDEIWEGILYRFIS